MPSLQYDWHLVCCLLVSLVPDMYFGLIETRQIWHCHRARLVSLLVQCFALICLSAVYLASCVQWSLSKCGLVHVGSARVPSPMCAHARSLHTMRTSPSWMDRKLDRNLTVTDHKATERGCRLPSRLIRFDVMSKYMCVFVWEESTKQYQLTYWLIKPSVHYVCTDSRLHGL